MNSEQIPIPPFSEQELRKQWNQQADKNDQWDSLDISEQLAWAQARALQSVEPAPLADEGLAELISEVEDYADQHHQESPAAYYWMRVATVLRQQQGRIAELEADPIRKAQAAADDLRVALNRMNVEMKLECARIQKGFLAVERPDIRYEFSIFDEDYAERVGGSAPTYAQALSEGQNYLAQYQQDGAHTLELRRVELLPITIDPDWAHALPIPQQEKS